MVQNMTDCRYSVKQLLIPVNDCNFFVQILELQDNGEYEYKGQGVYFRTEAEAVSYVREQMALNEQFNK